VAKNTSLNTSNSTTDNSHDDEEDDHDEDDDEEDEETDEQQSDDDNTPAKALNPANLFVSEEERKKYLEQEFQEAVTGYRKILKRLEHDNVLTF
jgi:hypothetical protein